MILKGSLKVTTLPEILHSICLSRYTGILTLQQYSVRKRVYFEEGKIAFAYSNQLRDSLGDVLLRTGSITLEQYLDTARQIRPGLRHGQILLREKVISANQLIGAVHRQVKDIIFSLFSWSEGSFEFEEVETSPETIKLNITSSDLILAGVKGIADWSILSKMITDISIGLEQSPDFEAKLAEIQLSEQESDIVAYAAGRSIREVLQYSLLNNFETARLLAGFLTIDLFRLVKPRNITLVPATDVDFTRLHRMAGLFSRVFDYIRDELVERVGPMAEAILQGYYNEVRQEEPAVLGGVSMGAAGRLDPDMLDLNVLHLDRSDKTDHVYRVFLRILSGQLKGTRELLGEEGVAQVETGIRRLVDNLAAE